MKYLIQVCLTAAMFCACKSSTTKPPVSDSTAVAVSNPADTLLGLYTSDFDGKKIYITINYARHNHLGGYNVHLGLRRNLSGSYQLTNDGFDLILNEPGDHPFDGKFTLHLSPDGAKGTGQWVPLNSTTLKSKTLALTKVSLKQSDNVSVGGDYPLSGDHRDILFASDGGCILNYYEMLSDSSFGQQMITVRGTWEQKGDTLIVTWEKRSDIPAPATIYKMNYYGEGEAHFLSGVEGDDGTSYSTGP